MPKIKIQDVKKAVDLGKGVWDFSKEAVPVLKPIIEEHAPKVMQQVQDVANAAAEKGESARIAFVSNMQQKKEAKEKRKANEECRKKAVYSSLPPVTAKEFFKNFELNVSDASELDSGYMAFTGCYAIITMKSKGEKDLAAYEDAFVGCGSSVGLAVYSQLRGLGNIDVYADFKFKQPMWILTYPCNEDELGPKFARLLQDLDAADSYNKWDLQSLVTAEA